MSKFDAYYTLLNINPKEFLGIARDKHEENIITTLDKNVIIIINAKTRMQITSWSIKDKLSSKVVFDHRSQHYVGVFGCENDSSGLYKSALRCWDETTKDLNKVKKLKFNKGIADLVSCADDTYVLYYDGKCELLASAIERRKMEYTSGKILENFENKLGFQNAKVFTSNNGQKMLTYFEVQHMADAADLVTLVCTSIENGYGKNPVRFPLHRNNCETKLVGYTIIDGEASPVLATIWADKRLFLMKLDHASSPADAPGKFVSTISPLKTDSAISVVGVSQQCIVIYAANNNQEGASLMLYNIQFKIVKSTQFFKVYFEFSRLWSIRDSIIMAMGQNLSVVSYHVEKETLADLLGCQIYNCADQPIEADLINEDERLQESIQYKGFSDTSRTVVQEHKLLTASGHLADGKTIPYESIQEFDRDLDALKRLQMDVEVVLSNKPVVDNVRVVVMSNRKDIGFKTQEIQYISQELERCGASEHEITEKLLTVLMKANMLDDIESTLRRYTNISEVMIAKTISYIAKTIINSEETGKSEELGSLKKILYLLLSTPFDNITLAVAVRHELQYEEVFFLLEYLYNILTDDTQDPDRLEPDFDCLFFEVQILKWLGVLLDAYFQKLALASDVRIIDLVYKWSQLLDSYKEELEELNDLSSVLNGILDSNAASNQDKDCSQWYTIEEVIY